MEYKLMTELPLEINNLIYSYLGKSNTALAIEQFWWETIEEETRDKSCSDCDYYITNLDNKNYNGLCEYCYAKNNLGIEVYTCCDCGTRTFEWTNFNNSETGLRCNSCVEFDEEYEDDEDEDDEDEDN